MKQITENKRENEQNQILVLWKDQQIDKPFNRLAKRKKKKKKKKDSNYENQE